MEVDLSGRTAIVTGSSRGIGRTTALQLAKAGANVVTVARTESELEEVVEEIERHGVEGRAVTADVTVPSDIEAVAQTAADEFGAAEILINNAGTNLIEPPLENSVEEVDDLIALNFRGVFLMAQQFARAFRKSDADYGRIINISSILARVGVPRTTLYGGTKAGINGITRGLAAELAQDGITVNSVLPGLIKTDRVGGAVEEDSEDFFQTDRIPLERMGERTEIADVCVFLSSEYASYMTGASLLVDGGVDITAGLYNV